MALPGCIRRPMRARAPAPAVAAALLLLLLLLLGSSCSCDAQKPSRGAKASKPAKPPKSKPPKSFGGSPASPSASTSPGANDRVSINIVHVNDVHNRFEPDTGSYVYCPHQDDLGGKCLGGYARIATVVKQARSRDPEALFLNAGDEFLGRIWDVYYHGGVLPRYINMLKPDAFTLGNHEFDYGSKLLSELIPKLNFPVLGLCNLNLTSSQYLPGKVQNYFIKTVKGKKIAIVGVVTPDTATTSFANDGEKFADPVEGLKRCMQGLYGPGAKLSVDAVIVLSHAGYEVDKRIAAEVADVDLVVGGHSHYLLWNGPTPLKDTADPASGDTGVMGPYPTYMPTTSNPARTVPVVTAFWASRYMGQLVLEVGGGRPSSVTGVPIMLGGAASANPVLRDPEMDAAVQDPALLGPVQAYAARPVGSAKLQLNNTASRYNETNLGNLVCDAAVEFFERATPFKRIDACLINSGAIRNTIYGGAVDMGDVGTALPYDSRLAVVTLTGGDLLLALSHSVSVLGGTSYTGRFAQVSGLRMVFDARRTAKSYNDAKLSFARLVYAKLLAEGGVERDIDACATYTVLTTQFMAGGGDSYSMLARAPRANPSDTPLQDIVAAYITARSPVAPVWENRATNCEFAQHPACTAPAVLNRVCGNS